MYDDRRKYLRDVLDELDRYLDDFEKSVQDSIRASLDSGEPSFSRRMVAGLAMGLGPEGRPSVQFFGDALEGGRGFRTPIYEQVVDETAGTLRLTIELPGVEKGSIEISALEERTIIESKSSERKYHAEIPLKTEIDPESGQATYNNGLLDIVFQLRQRTNKSYRRVRVV